MYSDLYVRLNRAYGYGGATSYVIDGLTKLAVVTPSDDIPYDPYAVYLLADWASDDFDSPFQAGQVVKVTNPDPTEWEGPIDFYDE